MVDSYRSVKEPAFAEITEKKSRFIGYIMPVSNEEEALLRIQQVKKDHHSARHHVFAHRSGLERLTERYSDDGEPSGTAGMPVLTVLSGEDILNAVIVVVRYFGGTLLGAGGLVRAYTAAAKAALASATVITNTFCNYYILHTDYQLSGKIQYEIAKHGYRIMDTAYSEGVTFHILVKKDQTDAFCKLITQCSNGTYVPGLVSSGYYE